MDEAAVLALAATVKAHAEAHLIELQIQLKEAEADQKRNDAIAGAITEATPLIAPVLTRWLSEFDSKKPAPQRKKAAKRRG